MSDMVNHPDHYTYGKVECIDAIETATQGLTGFESYATGTILKYLWRWRHKNGIEDLKKAQWYLERLIKFVEPPTSLAVREVGESFWES
jgi:hypothetical protein